MQSESQCREFDEFLSIKVDQIRLRCSPRNQQFVADAEMARIHLRERSVRSLSL